VFCCYCQKDVGDCICPDIIERLKAVFGSGAYAVPIDDTTCASVQIAEKIQPVIPEDEELN
jgi:hypothetical protein